MDTLATRLQVTEHGRLVAEVVGPYDYIYSLRSRYAMAKWRAGKPCGGMLEQRADLPRWWDVPVGARFGCAECGVVMADAPHAATCSYDQDYYEPRDEHDSPCDGPEAL